MAEGILSALARRVYDVRDTAEDYGRSAERRLRGGGNETRGELRRLWSQLEDLVERNFGASPTEAARTAGDYARDSVRTASDYARDYARDGREAAYDLADQLRSATRARPFVAIGIAVVATVVITSLLSGSRRR
jgi:ElaB/YqjD/DUF883 family membrane-anchored ribosome-binding protein